MKDEVLRSIAKTEATVQVLLTHFLEINIDRRDQHVKDMINSNVKEIAETIYQRLKNS